MSKLLSKASITVALVLTIFGAPAGIASAPTAQAQTTTSPSVSRITVDTLACNCYSYVASQIPNLPHSADLKPNTTPHVGAVAIFDYNGLPHYGIVTGFTEEGFTLKDSNFAHCKYMTHLIQWDDAHLVGFWSS